MIKPVNITPLNTSDTLEFECEKCTEKGVFHLTAPINTDNDGNPVLPLEDYECQKCGEKL